jgi:hypothetical protein
VKREARLGGARLGEAAIGEDWRPAASTLEKGILLVAASVLGATLGLGWYRGFHVVAVSAN